MTDNRELIRARFSSYSEAEEVCTRVKTLDGVEAVINRSNNDMSGDGGVNLIVGFPGNSNMGMNYPVYPLGLFNTSLRSDGWVDANDGLDINTFILEAWVPEQSAGQAADIVRESNGQLL